MVERRIGEELAMFLYKMLGRMSVMVTVRVMVSIGQVESRLAGICQRLGGTAPNHPP